MARSLAVATLRSDVPFTSTSILTGPPGRGEDLNPVEFIPTVVRAVGTGVVFLVVGTETTTSRVLAGPVAAGRGLNNGVLVVPVEVEYLGFVTAEIAAELDCFEPEEEDGSEKTSPKLGTVLDPALLVVVVEVFKALLVPLLAVDAVNTLIKPPLEEAELLEATFLTTNVVDVTFVVFVT